MSTHTATARPSLRERLRVVLASTRFQNALTALILFNAVTLGLETVPEVMDAAGGLLKAIDRTVLAIFALEIAAKLYAYGRGFWRDPWNVFDFTIVAISLAPAAGAFSVLRALRILRVLRLISVVPSMRRVVAALLGAIPGMASIGGLLLLVFYVAAVMATKLFAASFPEWFGSIPASMYSLFQIMTLESWSMGIVRPVMAVYPYAWLFFVPFILITSFAVLNLFIAIIVNAMQSEHESERKEEAAGAIAERARIQEQLAALTDEVRGLRLTLNKHVNTQDRA